MNIEVILKSEIQEFIKTNFNEDSSKLALKKNPFPGVDYKEIINQIEAKNKCKTKLPLWFDTKSIVYPSKISVEQTSSEISAKYKATLLSGKKLIDITGGFGVDAYYFSNHFENVIHCEINSDLSEIVKHNFSVLKKQNIQCFNDDGLNVLKNLNQKFNAIYIDPSRRNDKKGKVFLLADCEPNVPELLDDYFEFSDTILIKTAPILDLKAGLSELKLVSKIHIVAVENEVKEILWQIEKNFDAEIEIKTVNLKKNNSQYFDFYLRPTLFSDYSEPKKYLFEPNAAILKSGGFLEVAKQFKVSKLHQHSHLYTSETIIPFPGRCFEVEKQFEFSKKNMELHLKNEQINVTIRNFPDTVENLRKKYKIKEGGNNYCFFTTDQNEQKIVLICKKINENEI